MDRGDYYYFISHITNIMKCPHCQKVNSHSHMFLLKDDVILKDDEFEVKNSHSNPFGFSEFELIHNGQSVGWVVSGEADLSEEAKKFGYSIKIEEFS